VRLGVFENEVLRRVFGHKRGGKTGVGEYCVMKGLCNMYCTRYQVYQINGVCSKYGTD
jgi:hypothetical protein